MKTFKQNKIAIALFASALALGLSGEASAAPEALFGSPKPTYPISFEGITPTMHPGNFVTSVIGDESQVCYDMSALGYIGEVTGDMVGIKVDPPTAFSNSYLDVILSSDMRYLAWDTDMATMLAVIVKGGPNYHLYDYTSQIEDSDSWLASPLNTANRIPQISHYNICYKKDVPLNAQGCTPGYWRNHLDRWEGYTAVQDFNTVFGVANFLSPEDVNPNPNVDNIQPANLVNVLQYPQVWGTFPFHATAALLNSTGGVPNADGTTVKYPYTTEQVITIVQEAVNTFDDPNTMTNETFVAIEAAKDLLATANELGCPLSGTPACNNPATCQ